MKRSTNSCRLQFRLSTCRRSFLVDQLVRVNHLVRVDHLVWRQPPSTSLDLMKLRVGHLW